MDRASVRAGNKPGSLRKIIFSVAITLTIFSVSGCGLLSGSAGEEETSAPGRTKLTVGSMPVVATAAFQLALEKGYFDEAGLDIETRNIPGGSAAVPLLNNGELDISWGNWPSFLQAQSQGAADLKLITDGYQASEGMMMLQAMPNQGIDNVEDLKGKTIAINTHSNIIELITRSVLETHGLTAQDVTFKKVDFPDMPAALQSGAVDAASLTEPFVAKSNQLGAFTLADAATGPTADIPIAGFASSSKVVQENPDAVAKFQQVMARASDEATQDRSKVEELLPKYSKVDPKTARLVQIGTFPSTLEPRRLERISNLMQRFDIPPNGAPADVRSMIHPMPGSPS